MPYHAAFCYSPKQDQKILPERRGFVTTVFDIQSLIDKHDSHLFRSIAYPDHFLHYLLPEKLSRSMNLRPRRHNYTHYPYLYHQAQENICQ